jgi:AhpD family alkylhydroperoxidase
MSKERFAPLSARTASEAARPMVAASEKAFGFLPSPVAKAAHSPALLSFLLAGFSAFDRTGLSPLEREVVAMTVAFENDCHYCMAMHSALLSRQPDNAALVRALRAGAALEDPRLEAVRQFVRAILRNRGQVPAERWEALELAGFDEGQALELLLGTSVYVLSTLANVLTGAEDDPAFAAFRWRRPDAAEGVERSRIRNEPSRRCDETGDASS